jgi:hypothetical protein
VIDRSESQLIAKERLNKARALRAAKHLRHKITVNGQKNPASRCAPAAGNRMRDSEYPTRASAAIIAPNSGPPHKASGSLPMESVATPRERCA